MGSSAVKAVKLQPTAERMQLVRAETAPIAVGAEGDGRAAAVGQLLGEIGAREVPLLASVGGTGTVLRRVSLPRMTVAELRTALSFEAEKYIPFRLEEVFFDCCILGERPNGQMEILLAAARKELVDDLQALLSGKGFTATAVDLDMVALANAWEALGSAQGEAVTALIHVGHRGTVVDFFSGSQLQFAREIALGGQFFTKALSEELRLDALEAERLKCQPDARVEEVQRALRHAWEEWLGQCRGSFDFYENQYGRRVDQLLLTGGSAALAGFKDWIQQGTGMPAEIWDPMAKLECGPEVRVPEGARAAYSVALGLALRGGAG